MESHSVAERRWTCDKAKYEKCGIDYAKSLGIDPMPQDPMKFFEHVRKMFGKYGAKGFLTVCKYISISVLKSVNPQVVSVNAWKIPAKLCGFQFR